MTDEIGWLDFYAACPPKTIQERRKSKLHAIQAEKEIALSAVFTVCYDVYSGFAHFSRSTQQSLDTGLLEFLLQRYKLPCFIVEVYFCKVFLFMKVRRSVFKIWCPFIFAVRACLLFVWKTTGLLMINQGIFSCLEFYV